MMAESAPAVNRPVLLVVDDTPQNLSLMSDLLEGEYTVKLAPNGLRAIKIALASPPDLILLDVMMPEMDGYSVCRILKTESVTKNIPVIFLTAMDGMQDEERGLAVGAVDYITKPISPSILLARVRNQLALRTVTECLRVQNGLLAEEKARAQGFLQRLKDATDKLLEQNRMMHREQEKWRNLLRLIGHKMLDQGHLDAAWDLWQELPLNGQAMEDLYTLAMRFEAQLQSDKAVEVFLQMSNFDPHYRDIEKYCGSEVRHTDIPVPETDRPAASEMPRSLGRYLLHRVLGQGASSQVFLGSDPVIGRVVAIKAMVLAADGDRGEEDVRELFFREAESAGSLIHPNIVSIYDAGEENGFCYIAMEYLRGRDLGGYVRPGELLPLVKVLAIAEHVAEALAVAHAVGIVHRDIKPANIVYEQDNEAVKVTDFGIASMMRRSASAEGVLFGTPSFMSPEQCKGLALDGRSDLFSLGVTLYQLLCGYLPFQGTSLSDLMEKIMWAEPVDIRTYNPLIPACVHEILTRAMAKDPLQRFQSAEDMGKALHCCRRSLSVFAS